MSQDSEIVTPQVDGANAPVRAPVQAPDPSPGQAPALWDGALAEARSLIGIDLRRTGQTWNTEASPDGVRHFCWGLGDENALFCDPDYGTASAWGSALAPGCFLYTIDTTVVAPKLRGIQWLYGGTDWEWHRPIRHRDRFTVRARLFDAVEKQGGNVRSFIIQTGEVIDTNQRGERVARAPSQTARTPRTKAEGGLKYAARETHRYTQEELEHIAHAIETEELRGAAARFWEDVEVGAAVQPMLKGPLNITDMVCWHSGGGHSYQAHRRATMHRRRHPADGYVDPVTVAQDSAARGHAEAGMAREVGMPGSYDVGTQRISWLGQLMTNWMGDEGFLRRLNVSLRRPNIFGDVSWCRASVAGKRVQDGVHLVDLALRIDNQLGETTAEGEATVELPSRAGASPSMRLGGKEVYAMDGAQAWDGLKQSYRPHAGWQERIPARVRFHREQAEAVDPVTFEVIRQTLWTINIAYGETITRVSGSPVLATLDFNMSILTADAEVVLNAPYVQFLNAGAPLGIRCIQERYGERPGIDDGDIFCCNDPWIGACHQMDVLFAAPIFVDGMLFGWVANAGHQYDLGGIVPGGWPQNAEDVYADPIVLPPFKLVERGEMGYLLDQFFFWLASGPAKRLRGVHKQPTSSGLVLSARLFDGGGLSGGTMERPALPLLLAAIPTGRVDAVVLCKVDKRTRSQTDTATIVEVSDAENASSPSRSSSTPPRPRAG